MSTSTKGWRWATDVLMIDAYRRIFSAAGREAFNRSLLLFAVLGVIEGVGLFAVIPTLSAFTTGQPVFGLTWKLWVVVLAVLALAGAGVNYLASVGGYMAAIDLLKTLNTNIGNKIATLPLGWFKADTAGKISHLLTGSLMTVGEGAAHFSGPIVRSLGTVLVMMVLAWFWSWQLALTLLVSIPVMLLLGLASRWLKDKGESYVQPTGRELAARLVEFTQTQPALRACGAAKAYPPLELARRENTKAQRRNLWVSVLGNVLSGMGAQALTVTLLVLTITLGASAHLSPIETVAFVGVILRYMYVLSDLQAFLLAIEVARKPLEAVDSILQAQPLPEASQRVQLPHPGQVRFEDVSFAYKPGQMTVESISFTATPGTLTAIVGPSGSGKTTLLRLISRFWDVNVGSVSVGGVDVRDQPTEQLMEQLAMVFQDVYLYDSTLADNIRVGNPQASEEQVRAAGILAGVDEIARRLPGGWEARVGEGGGRLSGGERQRVSVARALLKQAPILLFDEATSALDPENEAQIERALEKLRHSSTLVVVAHKLGTIANADQIVVLDHCGRITQVGTHSELVGQPGLYQQLWRARAASRGWALVSGDDT